MLLHTLFNVYFQRNLEGQLSAVREEKQALADSTSTEIGQYKSEIHTLQVYTSTVPNISKLKK